MRNNKITYTRKTQKVGDGLFIPLPIDIANYLNIKKGDEITMMPDHGNHGAFLSIWNPKQQKK